MAERPEIFLLSLAFQDFLDEIYSSFFDNLSKLANLKRAKTSNGAIRYLEANNPKAILVTDEGLARAANGAVLEKVLSYLRNGGLVAFGVLFSNWVSLDAWEKLFNETFGLPWRQGDYHRATFQFNPSCTLPTNVVKDSFPSPYSMKAVHVQDARPHEKIFVPVPGAMTESHVFTPSHVDETQAAVAGATVGNGFLVYAGDVNPEVGSEKVMLTLLGL